MIIQAMREFPLKNDIRLDVDWWSLIREPACLYTGGLLLAWQIDAPKSRLCSLPWRTWARSWWWWWGGCWCWWWFRGIGNHLLAGNANLRWTMSWAVGPRSHTRDHLCQKIRRGCEENFAFTNCKPRHRPVSKITSFSRLRNRNYLRATRSCVSRALQLAPCTSLLNTT